MVTGYKMMFAILLILSSIFLVGCEEVNLYALTDASIDAYKGVTLSSADVIALSQKSVLQLDSEAEVADEESEYHRRLYSLIGEIEPFENRSYSIKVYVDERVNAFALPDGSIRIYSGLMDMFDDDELMFVIGHEMGHVSNEDALDKMRVAYGARAVQKGLSSIEGSVGEISSSWIGDLGNAIINSQFSQQEERDADDFGLYYISTKGIAKEASVSALNKLAGLGNDHSFLSTHPNPGSRAKRLVFIIANTNESIIYPKTLAEKGMDAYEALKDEVLKE